MFNSQQPQTSPKENKDGPKMPRFNLNWIYIIIIGALAIMLYQGNTNPGSFDKEVSYSEIKDFIAKGYTKELVVDKSEGVVRITIIPTKIREVFKKSAEDVQVFSWLSSYFLREVCGSGIGPRCFPQICMMALQRPSSCFSDIWRVVL